MFKEEVGAAGGLLRGHELFHELDEPSVNAVLGRARVSRLGPDMLLTRQGDPPKELTLLVSGQAKLTRVTDDGRQSTIRLLGSGDLIGCVAIFRGCPYPASAVTLGTCDVYAWPREHLVALMMSHPRLTMNALSIISGQLIDVAYRGSMQGSEPARRRLATLIMTLTLAADDAAGRDGVIRMTRQELGELCGATFFTVSRILSRWARAGIVASGRGSVRIIDRARLARIASGGPSVACEGAKRCN